MPLFSRRDGEAVRDVPAYRRIMPFLMRTKAESVVLFEQRLDATKGLAFIREWNATHARRISFMHLVLWAMTRAMHERPRLNRFVMGGRLYQRKGIWFSLSAKKAFSDDAPIVVVKREFLPDDSFEQMVERLAASIEEGKSPKESRVDKELSLFLRIPAPILMALVGLVRRLDAWNLLPFAFYGEDPMYASAFVANLGSVKLDAAYHHLYEYGNIPLFVTVGQVGDAVFAKPDGTAGVRPEAVLRWTYDERIEDGLYCAQALEVLRRRLEDPAAAIREVESGPPAARAGGAVG